MVTTRSGTGIKWAVKVLSVLGSHIFPCFFFKLTKGSCPGYGQIALELSPLLSRMHFIYKNFHSSPQMFCFLVLRHFVLTHRKICGESDAYFFPSAETQGGVGDAIWTLAGVWWHLHEQSNYRHLRGGADGDHWQLAHATSISKVFARVLAKECLLLPKRVVDVTL